MVRPQATHEVLVDDDKVRVTRWDFVPGAETGWHRHGMDYVVTTLTPCSFLLEEPGGGSRRVEMNAGAAYRRDEGSSTMWSMRAQSRCRSLKWN